MQEHESFKAPRYQASEPTVAGLWKVSKEFHRGLDAFLHNKKPMQTDMYWSEQVGRDSGSYSIARVPQPTDLYTTARWQRWTQPALRRTRRWGSKSGLSRCDFARKRQGRSRSKEATLTASPEKGCSTTLQSVAELSALRRSTARARWLRSKTDISCRRSECSPDGGASSRAAAAREMRRRIFAASGSQAPVASATMGTNLSPCSAQTRAVPKCDDLTSA